VHISDLLDKLGSEPIVYVRSKKDKNGKARERKRIGKPLGGTSLVRVWSFMHRMLAWASRKSLVARNVVSLVDKPEPSLSKARALTTDEAAALLALAEGSRYHAFLLLALTTGCRRGEPAALQWNCVDFINQTILVRQAFGEDRRGGHFIKTTKSGRVRNVPLAAAAVETLRAVHVRQAAENLHAEPNTYQDQRFVFADKFGNPPDLNGLSKAFAELAKLAGIKGVTLHSCRHFMATSAIVEGSDINSVSAVLGHGQPSTTLNIYGHFLDGGKVAAIQRVGDALAQAQARHASSQNRPADGVQSRPAAGALQPNCNQSEDVAKARIG
jgi:integrase